MIASVKQLKEILRTVEDISKANKSDRDTSLKQRDIFKALFDVRKQLWDTEYFDLGELYTDGLDKEQIWQQIELINNGLPKIIDVAKKSQKSKKQVQFAPSEIVEIEQLKEQIDESEDSEDETVKKIMKKVKFSDDVKDASDEELFNDISKDGDSESEHENGEDENVDEESDDDEENFKTKAKRPRLDKEASSYEDPLELFKKAIRSSKKSDNDAKGNNKDVGQSNYSRFFDLAEMNAFLDKQDALEGREIRLDDDDEEEGEDGCDEDAPIKYDDFFDQPDKEENEEEDDDIEEDEIEGEDESPSLVKDGKDKDSENLSSFEKRIESMQKKAFLLEEKVVAEKQWQMKGEVTHADRPVNSLIDKQVEFGVATQPAIITTPEICKKIEEILCQRAMSQVWDGPKRKVRTKEAAFTLNKKVVLDQEKSKLSLAEIYENEYLEQLKGKEEKLPAEIEEIQSSMTALFRKLDALSNFHFNPKPAVPDVKIISNVPAVNMEEVAPVAMTEAMTLAPEEILDKSKRDLVGATERSETDKKRANRLRKKKQHFKKLEKEDREKIKKLKAEKRAMHKSGTDDHMNSKEIKKNPKNYGKKRPKRN